MKGSTFCVGLSFFHASCLAFNIAIGNYGTAAFSGVFALWSVAMSVLYFAKEEGMFIPGPQGIPGACGPAGATGKCKCKCGKQILLG